VKPVTCGLPPLVNGPQRLVRAVNNEFGGEVARLLTERGMSLRQAARLTHYDPSYLSKVISGRKAPSLALAAALDVALGADGALTALASGGLDPGDAGRLGWTLASPRRVDHAAVAGLAAVLAAQRRAEDALGSAAVLPAVAAQLGAVETLVTEARGPVRPAVVEVGAEWAQYAGWLHASTGQDAKAARLYDQALAWAVEAAAVSLVSEVISLKGQMAWTAGQPGPVIGLSQAAQRDPAAFPGQHAISAAQEARGHAMTGDAAATERCLGEAAVKASEARERQDEAPPWLYYHSPGFFDLQRGLAYRFLGADPRYRRLAIEALRAGHAALRDEERSSEWGAVFLCHLAAVHGQGGDVGQACAVAMDAAAIARQLGSAPLTAQLSRLRAGMARRWPAEQAVTELAEALR
jgi:transcriptional regulator with XRE-family HTH domain